jgi:K+-transporting ATPase A subunit
MNKLIKLGTVALLNMLSLSVVAQEAEMADTMRTNGKIYVVVAIVLVILVGLIGYLVSIDLKVSKLEKRLPEKK